MFGFSLAELFLVLIVALVFIKPQDLPEIAHFFGRVFYRGKRMFNDLRSSFKEMEKELGIGNLKEEINRGIAEEKSKIDDLTEEMTVIVDMYGNEHKVPNIKEVRSDLTDEELKDEIEKENKKNSKNPDAL